MTQTKCDRCKEAVPGSQIRYVSANKYVCIDCYEERQGTTTPSLSVKKYDATPENKEKLKCSSCGYVNAFSPKAEMKRRCGYCGSEQLTERPNTAADLLASVETE